MISKYSSVLNISILKSMCVMFFYVIVFESITAIVLLYSLTVAVVQCITFCNLEGHWVLEWVIFFLIILQTIFKQVLKLHLTLKYDFEAPHHGIHSHISYHSRAEFKDKKLQVTYIPSNILHWVIDRDIAQKAVFDFPVLFSIIFLISKKHC